MDLSCCASNLPTIYPARKINISYQGAIRGLVALHQRYGLLSRTDRRHLEPAFVQSVFNHTLQKRIVLNHQYCR